MRRLSLGLVLTAACAHGPAGASLRTGAAASFVGAAVLAGTGTYFAVESNTARAQLAPLDAAHGRVTTLTQAQAFSAFQQATNDGRAASVLLVGAACAGLGGAYLWWKGGPVDVAISPAGVAVRGSLP